MTPLNGWENFYVIVGSSAGVLIGLQFVVLTLIAERPPLHAEEAGAAFATPTIVHFGAVLLLSAIVGAPWDGILIVAFLCGILGFSGAAYAVIIAQRLRRQTTDLPPSVGYRTRIILLLTAVPSTRRLQKYTPEETPSPLSFVASQCTVFFPTLGKEINNVRILLPRRSQTMIVTEGKGFSHVYSIVVCELNGFG